MILFSIIATYLIYNLLSGLLFFSIKYYRTERMIVNKKEFALLILFPLIGYGTWRYNRELRTNGDLKFPKEWFVWKHIIPIHIGYLILLAVIGFILHGIASGSIGGGMDWANQQTNASAIGIGLLADLATGFVLLLVTIIAIFGFGILAFLLLFIPKYQVKRIERRYYQEQSELHKQQ